MKEQLIQLVHQLRSVLWGMPLLMLLVGTGVYLTFLLKGVQFRYLWFGMKELFIGNREKDDGDMSVFQSLMTTIAGAVGTGAIVGVVTAITVGGFGALFWMWVVAFFGMATKYAEALLAVKYREKDKNGEMIGGPMEYMERGFKKKWMAIAFAIFGSIAAIGTGNLVQVHSIASAINTITFFNPWIIGTLLAFVTGLVIVGGVRSIGMFAGVLVPLMSIFYLVGGILILCYHLEKIPEAFQLIFSGAFQGQSAVGGFAGATIMAAIEMGVARGVFSNEAGLGISSIAAAAAKTDSPARQALITMAGTLISTLVICTITGLVVAVTGVLGTYDAAGNLLNGAPMAITAFDSTLTGGRFIVCIGLVLFAFSTVIAWAYYGEKCFEYLFGEKSVKIYRILFVLLIIPGSALDLELVWAMADISNGLMAIPNLITLIALSKVLVGETKIFKLKLDNHRNAKKYDIP